MSETNRANETNRASETNRNEIADIPDLDAPEYFIYDIWLRNYYLDPRDTLQKPVWEMNPGKSYKIKECTMGGWKTSESQT